MPALEGLTPLETRKRELLLESELNRAVLQIELGQWQLKASRWQSRLGILRVCSPLLFPAIRMLFRRKREESRSRSSLLGALWQFLSGLRT